MIAVVAVGIFQKSDTFDTGNSFCDTWFHKYDSSLLHNKKYDPWIEEIVLAINLATPAIFRYKIYCQSRFSGLVEKQPYLVNCENV